MKKALLLPFMILILLVSTVYALEDGLRISDLTIYQDSDLQRSIGDGSVYNEFIVPGGDIKFEIELENTFIDKIDIEDIEISITLYNITENEDIFEDVSSFDLNYDKTKTKSIRLNIPDDAEEVQKTVEINIQGIDENDTIHKIDWFVYLNIEDEGHDVRIYNTQLNQTIVNCGETVKLIVWIVNDGKHDEEEVVLEIENKELGLHNVYDNIEIDEDEKYAKRILLNFDNVNKSGKFPLQIKTYYKDDHLDDLTTIDLWVNQCKNVLVIDDEDISEEESDTQTTAPQTNIDESDTKKQNIPVMLLAFFIVILVILIIIVVVWLIKE
ncbi:hypothetical protein CEE44_00380 [Candidatus Woesearchaeota archaeon B3_Woes]|nr:MAG: hypothetical protein CEE44_00380 [Candidatus Woesearchaeota archaeon B3_Woes]